MSSSSQQNGYSPPHSNIQFHDEIKFKKPNMKASSSNLMYMEDEILTYCYLKEKLYIYIYILQSFLIYVFILFIYLDVPK